MFGRVDFREDGKKMRKIKKGKLFGEYLVGWGRWENEGIFSPGPLKSFFPKM